MKKPGKKEEQQKNVIPLKPMIKHPKSIKGINALMQVLVQLHITVRQTVFAGGEVHV